MVARVDCGIRLVRVCEMNNFLIFRIGAEKIYRGKQYRQDDDWKEKLEVNIMYTRIGVLWQQYPT